MSEAIHHKGRRSLAPLVLGASGAALALTVAAVAGELLKRDPLYYWKPGVGAAVACYPVGYAIGTVLEMLAAKGPPKGEPSHESSSESGSEEESTEEATIRSDPPVKTRYRNLPVLRKQMSDLHRAAHENDTKAIKRLVKRGTPVDVVGALGFTPLHIAVMEPVNPEAALLLVRLGADPRKVDQLHLSPLDHLRGIAQSEEPAPSSREQAYEEFSIDVSNHRQELLETYTKEAFDPFSGSVIRVFNEEGRRYFSTAEEFEQYVQEDAARLAETHGEMAEELFASRLEKYQQALKEHRSTVRKATNLLEELEETQDSSSSKPSIEGID